MIRDYVNGSEMTGVNVRYMSTFIGHWYLYCDGLHPGSAAWFGTKPLLPTGYIKPRGRGGARHIIQAPWRVLILIGSAEELRNFIQHEGLGEYISEESVLAANIAVIITTIFLLFYIASRDRKKM